MKRIEFGEYRMNRASKRYLRDCMNTNWVSGGPKVELFEKKWKDKFGLNLVATSSGTDAVICSCLALYEYGAVRGKEIIVPALSFIATSNAVRAAGFKPVFVDVDWDLNINADKIESAINNNTVAIMCVHTMGRMCEMDKIMKLAEKYSIMVIEDACEAYPATYKGRSVGKWGDMACYSFYQAHMINAGEGGAVSTKHDEMVSVLKSVRSHGRDGLYFDHKRVGYNSKMNDLEAALALGALEDVDETVAIRQKNVWWFRECVQDFNDKAWFTEEREGDSNCPHGFSITVKDPDDFPKLKRVLDKYNIHWKRNFGCIPTQHKAFADMGYDIGEFPVAEHIGDYGLHIGCHQYLKLGDIKRVCKALREGLS